MEPVIDFAGQCVSWVWDEPWVTKIILGLILAIRGVGFGKRGWDKLTGNAPTPEQALLGKMLLGFTESKNGWKQEAGDISLSFIWIPEMNQGTTDVHSCQGRAARPVEIKICPKMKGSSGLIQFGGRDMTKKLTPRTRDLILARAKKIKERLVAEADAALITSALSGKVF
jgi:hypothetical protein